MHPTRVPVAENVRAQLAAVLNDRLADTLDLHARLKHAHWNVKGPNFIALHEMFDEMAAGIFANADDIAERLAAFGGSPDGLPAGVAKRSALPPYPLNIHEGRATLEALAVAFAAASKHAGAAIALAGELNEPVTQDLFTEIAAGLDKNLWFIEAHLQAER